MKQILLISLVGFLCSCASSSKKGDSDSGVETIEYQSDQLKTMDIEQIQTIVYKKLASISEGGMENAQFINPDDNASASSPHNLLKDSLLIVLAKPDQDTGTSDLVDRILQTTARESSPQALVSEIADQGVRTLKYEAETQKELRTQNTYLYILVNLLGEIRPYVQRENDQNYIKAVKNVRDADLSISSKLKSYRLLNSMDVVENPSEIAEAMLDKKKNKNKK